MSCAVSVVWSSFVMLCAVVHKDSVSYVHNTDKLHSTLLSPSPPWPARTPDHPSRTQVPGRQQEQKSSWGWQAVEGASSKPAAAHLSPPDDVSCWRPVDFLCRLRIAFYFYFFSYSSPSCLPPSSAPFSLSEGCCRRWLIQLLLQQTFSSFLQTQTHLSALTNVCSLAQQQNNTCLLLFFSWATSSQITSKHLTN